MKLLKGLIAIMAVCVFMLAVEFGVITLGSISLRDVVVFAIAFLMGDFIGISDGHAEGYSEGFREGSDAGREFGKLIGELDGHRDGYKEGFAKGYKKCVDCDLLADKESACNGIDAK